LANQNLLSHYLEQKGIYWDAIEWNIKTSPLHGIHSKTTLKNVGVNNIHLDTLSLQLLQDSSTIAVKGIASNQKKGKLPFFHGTIEGMAQSNWAELTFSYLNEKKDSTFHVGIKASKAGNRITTSIFPKNPILFGGEFTANDSNYIAFEKDKPIEARLRIIDKKGTGISLYSMENPTAQQDLSLELHRLDLKNIAQSISEELQLSGILNTDLHFIKQNDLPILVNNINVEALNYNQQDLGNLNLTTDYIPSSDTEHAVETHLYLNDEEHMMISGTYHGGHKEKLESELSFFNFPLSFVSAFIPPQMLQLKGQLNGEMALRGKIGRLKANGFVRFDSTAISSRLIGTRSTLANHPVKVKNNKLRFNRFAMISSNGSPFTVDGNIDFSVIDKPKIDLKMNATNYEVLKAKRSPEALLYGKLYVDLKTRIKGTPSLLDIKGNIKVAGNSDVTYVISESALTVENRLENMVTFTNFKDRPSIRNNTVQEHYEMEGIQMLMNIDVDEGAFLNIDLDKKQKNYVKLQGGGHLTLQYSPQTDLQLSGKYLLNDGEMKYSLPIIPLKTFHIGKGSFLEWINDPMNPKLNITATEKMRSNVTLNSQSMPVDFNVGVKITNSLSNMGVSFLIDAPENSTIQNDLTTMSVSQRNKQAIAMLVTGVYLGGETSNGGKLNASNALNSFLQSEISSIAKSALKSVDISLGVEQVDENGDGNNHTDYSFRFAKRFWNNRLSIIIGGKVSSGTNRNDNAIIEDVALEWRLDKSGTRYVTLFHKQTYDNILDSEIKKTGVGIVLRKKMTKLGELFIFRRKKKTVKNETKK
jgi:hypothetical protein